MARHMGSSVGEALVLGGNRALAAALLGLAIWKLSARAPWPERPTPRFLVLHAGLGAAFVVILLGFDLVCFAAFTGRGLGSVFRESLRFLPFDALTGLFLYGLTSGVCYNLRAQERLREEAVRAAQARALVTEARLQALQAQLQPHFLYNALHSVGALVTRDPRAAEAALDKLGALLRYSLDAGPNQVPLEDEWRFTRDYLQLESLRLGERLSFEAQLSDEALDAPIPPFTLQPLVENAVRHAIAPRTEGGRLWIDASVRDGALRILVRDDGPGPSPNGGDGRGLRLVGERLHAFTGGAARLEVVPARGGGCEARLEVPIT
jgi:sensor histidine kinase YesM